MQLLFSRRQPGSRHAHGPEDAPGCLDRAGGAQRGPASGGQIFYKDYDDHIQVVSYTAQAGSFLAGKPRLWTPRPVSTYPAPLFDVTPDGKQVIAVIDADSDAPETHLRVVLNFSDEIRRRLAGAAK